MATIWMVVFHLASCVTGTLTFSDASGDRAVPLQPGTAIYRPAGIDHDVSNRSDAVVDFIELEVKPNG